MRLTEVHVNALESYDRRNNLEFEGIPSNVEDVNLEASVIKICNSIGIKINNNDIEDCHRLGKNDPKKVIVKMVNRKSCNLAIKNKKLLKYTDKSEIGFP